VEEIAGTLTRSDGLERALIVIRADGLATYRRQTMDSASGRWKASGPDCGLYDSVESAEAEARARIWWLAN